MKKFYETPAVEFTGFNAEDVITTSVIETFENTAGADKLNEYVAAGKINADATVSYSSYQW